MACWLAVKQNEHDTVARASIEDVADRTARADTQVRAVLGEVMAQGRSAGVAFDYVAALSPGTRANCWSLAESAGHEGWGRMQALLGSYRSMPLTLGYCDRLCGSCSGVRCGRFAWPGDRRWAQ